ncbi:hypothetical protein GMD78_00925 [Ornithinibacillus sp. L9]|uniref:Uncharacterized protein n=1 Tax=Ornithinibacillus caprae TaxID=2678566 RepID=A0A6N8FFF5_9BACI|nr:hypothetical protein [Ornithinibacillus caprae]MUK86964.1 hypothetical protein [Ornithinibacillus caprae]
MEKIRTILRSYGITPVEIEPITSRLYRITDHSNQCYALKKSSLSKESIRKWESVFHIANSNKLLNVIPVYLTRQGSLYETVNEEVFYVTPWLENRKEAITIEKLYRSIGYIHGSTKKKQTISSRSFISSFNRYQKYCETNRNSLLTCVEQFEQKKYMSPFELLVCTHYHVLERVFVTIQRRIEQLISELEDEETWSISLCHGNLSYDHVVNDNQTYLINWEKTFFDNPILDLATFFKEEVIHYDAPIESFIEHFGQYTDENKLQNSELYLLSIYLLDPTTYMDYIRSYQDSSNLSMVQQIKRIQHVFRQMVFALKFSDYVESEYESISLDDLES